MSTPPIADAFAPGQLVGGVYKIRAALGHVAMGRCFEADDQVLNRRVEIKVAHDARSAEVLLSEARVLAALSHPSVPVVHAAARHGDMHLLVSERLVGERLDQHIARSYQNGRPIALKVALDLLVEIAEVLAAVHHAGIVHRDVKPENVHLCGERGTVLGGFGLVVAELALADADLLHGGSPYYMAPEAITRTTLRGAGHLLDLYSYGVLAYELLTGSVPYDADELDTLLRLHREAPIPDVRTRRPNVPPKLAELVAELMAKEPGARPPTAEALLWRLRAVAVDVAARPYVARPMAMVVSDDLGFAAELRNRLQHWVSGVDIVVCSSGGDALTNLAQKSTQLLLLDLQLGDIGAIELLTQLRAGKHPQPEAVVALSEHASPTDLERLRALGVRSIVPRGKMTGAMLEPVVRNVLAADEPVPERLSLV